MRRRDSLHALVSASLLAAGVVTPAIGNERHFAYTYETAVLPRGAKEIEVWNTLRFGREHFYSRIEHRLEFEAAITDRLMGALYLNFKGVSEDNVGSDGSLSRSTTASSDGLSLEFKCKLSDPVADPLGFALYGEVSAKPDESELEAKILLDKRIGHLLVAANLVGELELEYVLENAGGTMKPGVETEIVAETDLGVAYVFDRNATLGLEMRTHTEVVDGGMEHTAFFLGPTLGFATQSWWTSLTVQPQFLAAGESAHGGTDVEEHERFNARILLGFHL